jgi:HAD superfamily hydrolase (TIGR01509 family)
MASLLTDDFVKAAGLSQDPEAQRLEVARWHARKTALYRERVLRGELPPRPGVRRLIDEALSAGWQLAVASTSAPESVQAVLEVAAGRDNARRFAAVLAGDIVERKKPAPDIYLLALERLGAARESSIVIEDSQNGLASAVAAGLTCVITVNGYTEHERFDEAALVLNHLGEAVETTEGRPRAGALEPMRVLGNRSRARPASHLRLDDLLACLPEPAGQRAPSRSARS